MKLVALTNGRYVTLVRQGKNNVVPAWPQTDCGTEARALMVKKILKDTSKLPKWWYAVVAGKEPALTSKRKATDAPLLEGRVS